MHIRIYIYVREVMNNVEIKSSIYIYIYIKPKPLLIPQFSTSAQHNILKIKNKIKNLNKPDPYLLK